MDPGTGKGPLAGVAVLDLSSVGPASRCTRALADYGAEVVKVAPVPSHGGVLPDPPFHTYSGHRAMRRVQLDLKQEDGRQAFLTLASRADVVLESFRPGVVDRLGIGFEAVRAVNPGIVYCATSGYGQHGARSTWAGHDLDYLAAGGYLATTEPRADGGPPVPGATIADAAAGGLHAALAIATALFARTSTGHGAYLDVSVADGVLWLMSLAIDEELALGSAPGFGHDVLTGRYGCYGTYRAADGRWLAVGAIEQKFFANLCRALGCADLAPRQYDDSAQDEVRRALSEAFGRRPRDEWVDRLAGADTCVAPVLTVAETVEAARCGVSGSVVRAIRPGRGDFEQLAPVLAGMPAVDEPVELPDPGATHTDELLAQAGVERAEIDRWRAQGAVA